MNTPSQDTSLLTPTSLPDLRELVKDLYSTETLWHPCGLGTRLNWGPPIKSTSNPVTVQKINRIIEHSQQDLTITVEAGLPLADLQAALQEKKQWLSVDWPWGSQVITDPKSGGTIGGLVARGLSGSLRQQYMGIRDQLIGIGLIRSDGVSAKAGGKVVKNVAGYDLMRLLCGSWGSLAIITELTIRTNVDDDLVEAIRRPSLDPGAFRVFRSVFDTRGPQGKPLDELFADLKAPLLLLWGNRDPWMNAAGKRASFMRHAPTATTEVVLDAGHCPHDEVPDQVNKALLDWLETQ